jgi:hypothetical protein
MEQNEDENLQNATAAQSAPCDAQAAGGSSAAGCGRASGVRLGEVVRERRDNLGVELTADDASDGGMPRRAVTAEETSKILSLHHAEGWPIGTIGAQLGRHHDTVERVLAQSGLEVHKESKRPRLVDAYIPFLKETLAKYPRLGASRLWCVFRSTRAANPAPPGHPFRTTRARSERSDGIPRGRPRGARRLRGRLDDQLFFSVFFLPTFNLLLDGRLSERPRPSPPRSFRRGPWSS